MPVWAELCLGSMAILLLIRHAMTDATGKRLIGWTPGIHLSEQGRRQADALAERLADVPIHALYTSPLERCRETAAPLARTKRLRPSAVKDLGETRAGDWTGKPLRQLARTKLWRTVQVAPSSFRFPGGESVVECQDRVVAATSRLVGKHDKQVVALVSHGDPIRLLLAHYAGVHLDLFQRITVNPASVSVVAAGDGMPRIIALNHTGDLRELVQVRKDRK